MTFPYIFWQSFTKSLVFCLFFVQLKSVNAPQPILIAAKRAGVTPHLIRAWEKRYHAVSPDRTHTNRRLYSEDEIERLRLLGVLTKSGHRIGDIARQSTSDLRQLAALETPTKALAHGGPNPGQTEAAIEDSLAAIQQMDTEALQAILKRALVALGQRGLLERVISPLTRRMGEQWRQGSLSAAHEHFASSILRGFLLDGARAFAEGMNAPVMIVTTPIGQLHELGAAMAAAYARDLGWRVLYLGPSLPAADVAHAAIANGARAVVMSIVFPPDDPRVPRELAQLRELLPAQTSIIVGGESARAYTSQIERDGVILTNDLDEFSVHLARLRQGVSPGNR